MRSPGAAKHRRRSIRLRGYDYRSGGAYFITICTHKRTCLFGKVVFGEMRLCATGRVARKCWMAIPKHFPRAKLDAFVIMPDHVHGIIWINDDPRAIAGSDNDGNIVGAKDISPPPKSCDAGVSAFRSPSKTVGSIVRGFKIGVTKWIRAHTGVREVWQRNYYEHIIRNEAALQRIRAYIEGNPGRWADDGKNTH